MRPFSRLLIFPSMTLRVKSLKVKMGISCLIAGTARRNFSSLSASKSFMLRRGSKGSHLAAKTAVLKRRHNTTRMVEEATMFAMHSSVANANEVRVANFPIRLLHLMVEELEVDLPVVSPVVAEASALLLAVANARGAMTAVTPTILMLHKMQTSLVLEEGLEGGTENALPLLKGSARTETFVNFHTSCRLLL